MTKPVSRCHPTTNPCDAGGTTFRSQSRRRRKHCFHTWTQAARIAIEQDGSYVQVEDNGSRRKLEKASITLNDCLACSGCVTSAEAVLVEMQNHREFLKAVADEKEARAVRNLASVCRFWSIVGWPRCVRVWVTHPNERLASRPRLWWYLFHHSRSPRLPSSTVFPRHRQREG